MNTPRLIRPTPADLPGLSALCLRSKAQWGYDADFMAACVPVLTLTDAALATGRMVMALGPDATRLAVVRVAMLPPDPGGTVCDLDLLFVDPPAMGRGIGAQLFRWAAGQARDMGAHRLLIEADPGAAPFYAHMGAHQIGSAPSGAVAERMLPLMALDL
jgi:GNAT superfamily N-acetyltransferase